MECLGVFDDDGEEAPAHGDGELVEESGLAEDDEELRVPRVDEPDVGAPGDVFVAGVVAV